METETQARSGDDLLIAKQKVVAARSRAATPSDNTGGKSDQNDT